MGYEKLPFPTGHLAHVNNLCGCEGTLPALRAQLHFPPASRSRHTPLFPRQLHLLAASNRAWHPFGGGGLRFILLPLTY